ncbi:Threonine/homoserine efflux transporter RhtA [Flavobacterium resistens]|uniref:EamA family transporter n=1 Tax=Flavobacterium resistens TaxID=443612 RepID=A0A521DK22_9FLAO|nr:DMT family transporter [Flavobacterium resistens]MRX68790.1 EamA family transporter [Flavobacterium resistens]SMO72084.1 Threonine/homoserine efflux transporter RhtA [Flavobacterium resistens]
MKNSYFLLHLAVFLAGFTGVFGKLITLNEGLLTFYRVLFSAIILFILTRFLKIGSDTTNSEKKSIGKVGILITVHWVFFYASIKYSNISIGVICYCLTSFFTAIFKPLIDKTNFKFTELVLSTLTLAGISLIFHFDASYQLGIILGVISSAFAALYTIYNERLVQFYDSRLINYYQMVSGSIFLIVLLPAYLYFFPVKTIAPDLSDTIYLILLALFCTVGLYVLFAEVLKKIPAFTVNLTFNLEPIYAIVIAFLFFNESKSVNTSFYAGILFIISSVVLQSYASSKTKLK